MIEVKTEKFSGPLGLLLSLIESEELDITEISLAKIADEYVEYIRQAEDINPEEMADFLVVAAKLLYIKSKALLPYLYNEEDEAEVDDLERQLKMYKEFIAASQKIKEILAAGQRLYIPSLAAGGRSSRRQAFNLPAFSPPARLDARMLQEKFIFLLAALRQAAVKPLAEVALEGQVNIEEKISYLKNMLSKKIKVSFTKLLAQAATRTEVIVSFLALLELAKQRELVFEQAELFSEIHIIRQE